MPRVPNEYHFVFGMSPHFGGKPFSFIHYQAIKACHEVNRPDRINLYFSYEPSGEWWDRARPYLTCIKVESPTHIFGNPITHHAHMTDVLRLQILLERGGVYLDMDVLCLRPFDNLMDEEMVLGEECGEGLCNAVIVAKPGAAFLKLWLDSFRTFRRTHWGTHAVHMPGYLASQVPHLIRIVNHRSFFWPMYWTDHQRAFFFGSGSDFSAHAYCVHLWEQINWPFLRYMTPVQAWLTQSEFSHLLLNYMDHGGAGRDVVATFPGASAEVDRIMQRLGAHHVCSQLTTWHTLDLLHEIVGRLGSAERELFSLHFLYGLSCHESAHIVKCSPEQVLANARHVWHLAVSYLPMLSQSR